MRKIKKTVLIFLVQLMIVNIAQARCNLELFRFGSSIVEVEKQITGDAIVIPNVEKMNREEVFYPGEEACKGEKSFEGSPVTFVFLYDKLVEIQVRRFSENPTLASWAESIYGEKKKKPRSFYAKNPNATWIWDNFNAVIFYSVVPDYQNLIETIVIQSKHHQRYFEKISKEQELPQGEL
jgi:hypothetical protein